MAGPGCLFVTFRNALCVERTRSATAAEFTQQAHGPAPVTGVGSGPPRLLGHTTPLGAPCELLDTFHHAWHTTPSLGTSECLLQPDYPLWDDSALPAAGMCGSWTNCGAGCAVFTNVSRRRSLSRVRHPSDTADHMHPEVERGRSPRGGEDVTVIHEQHV